MKLRSLRSFRLGSFALAFGLLAGGAVACSQSSEEDTDEGALAGFNRDELFTGRWTNWYDRKAEPSKSLQGFLQGIEDATTRGTQRAKLTGLLKIAEMRDWLLESNLFDTNAGKKVERIGQGDVRCDSRSSELRTIDGTCNDASNPAMGAAYVRFGRNVPLEATMPDARLLEPSPREVSRKLLARPVDGSGNRVVKEVPFLNLLALTWIQFMNHDWFSHGSADKTPDLGADQLIEMPLAQDDPFRQAGMAALYARKTETLAPSIPGRAPAYYNENTHWWDGSQLYGSSKAVADALRKNEGGVLKAELDLPEGFLPVKDGQEQSGFIRNWWVGLSLMHSLFAREHNAIVAELRRTHSELSEDDLYDHARMINAAVMAKIHTIEWTPAILPNPTLNLGMHGNWYGVKTAMWGEAHQEFLTGDALSGRPTDLKTDTFIDKLAGFFHLDNIAINGIVGGRKNLGPNNVPFTLTEEFTSVYRLHSLLPENLQLRTAEGTQLVPAAKTRNTDAATLNHQYSLGVWLTSFGNQKPGQLVLHNFPAFLQDLDIPGFTKYDVGAADILRDRERGVPRYNKFRELMELKPLASIDELTDDEQARRELKAIYNNDINQVDLLVGTLAESHRPEFFGFGETQFQIFIVMASRRLMADRFYTEDFNEKTYTAEGIKWIEQANFKRVLVRNFPELAEQTARIENAFVPWDGSVGKAVPVKFPGEPK
jgi:hypothetical protein